jgi:hypothetical protein
VDINNLFGLPAHPLLVHIPVVLIPLATVGSLFVAIRSSWRKTFAIPVAVLAIVGAAGVFLATKSGSSLEERVKESDLVQDHKSAGEAAEPWAALYMLLAVGVAGADFADRRLRARSSDPAPGPNDGPIVGTGDAPAGAVATVAGPATTIAASGPATRSALSRIVPILAVVTLLSGCVATYFVYEAGHTGAKATWQKTANVKGEGGGEGGEGGG